MQTMVCMTKPRPSDANPDGAWTSETLPLKVRRDLMKRELRKVLADRNVAAASEGTIEADQTRPGLPKTDKTRS
jgi:hypothetical protein